MNQKRKPSGSQCQSIDESFSDCEIIEQVTPLIVIDDDITQSEPIERPAEENCITVDDTNIVNDSKNDTNEGASSEPEVDILFFEDTVPSANFVTPAYDVEEKALGYGFTKPVPVSIPKKSSSSNVKESSQSKAMEPSQSNSENIQTVVRAHLPEGNNEAAISRREFRPDPKLSSTQIDIPMFDLNDSSTIEENVIPLNTSINNNDTANASVRCTTTITQTETPSADLQLSVSGERSADNQNSPSSMQRKLLGHDESVGPRRKEAKGVVTIDDHDEDDNEDDQIDDEDDSIVFVSETIDHSARNQIARKTSQRLVMQLKNGKVNNRSTRAERRYQKLKRTAISRAVAAWSRITANENKNKKNKNNIANRSKTNSNNSKLKNSSITIDNPSTSKNASKIAAKVSKAQEIREEENLFAEQPELFEKRMIIIDGSNIARL